MGRHLDEVIEVKTQTMLAEFSISKSGVGPLLYGGYMSQLIDFYI